MCGRYRRTTQEEELARLYHIPIPKQTDLPISYNIYQPIPLRSVTRLALRLRNQLKIRGFCQSHRPLMTTSGTATKRVNVAAGGM